MVSITINLYIPNGGKDSYISVDNMSREDATEIENVYSKDLENKIYRLFLCDPNVKVKGSMVIKKESSGWKEDIPL